MIKQDWLDYFEAVNGRSATEAEIAQALAAGEFQEEQVAQEASQFVGAPVAPEQANAGFVAAPAAPEAPAQESPQFASAPEAPVQEAPQYTAAPEAPVQEAPQYTAAPEGPVQEAPQFNAAPEAPVQEAPQFNAAPEAPVFGAQQNSFQQAPQQQPQPGFGQPAPGQGFQQAPYPGQPQPGQSYYSQPSQFGIAVGGYWNWFLSALKRPSAEYNTKALNGIFALCLDSFCLDLGNFFHS